MFFNSLFDCQRWMINMNSILFSTSDQRLHFDLRRKRPPIDLRFLTLSIKSENRHKGRRCGLFCPKQLKMPMISALFQVPHRPTNGICVLHLPTYFNHSKSVDGDIVWVRVPPPAPSRNPRNYWGFGIFHFSRLRSFSSCHPVYRTDFRRAFGGHFAPRCPFPIVFPPERSP